MQDRGRGDWTRALGMSNDEAGENEVSRASQPDARRQHWSDEEKVWIVQESFGTSSLRPTQPDHGIQPELSIIS